MSMNRREFLAAAAVLLSPPQEKAPFTPTEANIEGPYYRKDAPFRTKLAEGLKGSPLVIAGRVLTPGGVPLKDAVIDVWHASADGEYDNESREYRLRGRMRTDPDGLYRYETVMPGQYDLGEAKRPAHIHYKVSVDAYRPLTTQLYFRGDPWISRDPFVRKSLIIDLDKAHGTFDIVLAKA